MEIGTALAVAVTEGDRARRAVPAVIEQEPGFDFSDLRIFTEIPAHDDFDVVAMRGLVIVFDRRTMNHEGFIPGKLYVRENQRPHACMQWQHWLETELRHGDRAGPSGPLRTRREVVQYVEHRAGGPAVRLASGHVDGPYYEHVFGRDFIGKVVGVYRPGGAS